MQKTARFGEFSNISSGLPSFTSLSVALSCPAAAMPRPQPTSSGASLNGAMGLWQLFGCSASDRLNVHNDDFIFIFIYFPFVFFFLSFFGFIYFYTYNRIYILYTAHSIFFTQCCSTRNVGRLPRWKCSSIAWSRTQSKAMPSKSCVEWTNK